MKVIHARAPGLPSDQRTATFTGTVWGDPVMQTTDNVTINNLLPGIFDTDRARVTVAGQAKKTGQTIDEVIAERLRTNPTRRFGQPDEFGAACAFLCSVHAGYMTGQNILMDGGQYPGTY